MVGKDSKCDGDHVKLLPPPLLEALRQGRVLPIVGAGFSKNAITKPGKSMPSWRELGQVFADGLADYEFLDPIDAISTYEHEFGRNSTIAVAREATLVDSVSPGDVHAAFAKLAFEIVVTTNFDFLLERASADQGFTVVPVVNQDQLASMAPEALQLLKVHGDFNNPGRLVLTEADYDLFSTKNELLVHYLVSLLLTRTPLLIGYSLDDPDFRSMWAVIGHHLGHLRKPAYALLAGADEFQIKRFARRGIKAVNLAKKATQYPEAYIGLFTELHDCLQAKKQETLKASSERGQEAIRLPDAVDDLCLFLLPQASVPFYRTNVFPALEKVGLRPLTPYDILSEGNILETVSFLVDKAAIVVVEPGSPRINTELGMAHARRKQILLVGTQPFVQMGGHQFVPRPENLGPQEIDQFVVRLKQAILTRLKLEDRTPESAFREAWTLVEKKEYRAAVILAVTALEGKLSARFDRDAGKDVASMRMLTSISRLIEQAAAVGILTNPERKRIRDFIQLRNQVVHGQQKVTESQARACVDTLEAFARRF